MKTETIDISSPLCSDNLVIEKYQKANSRRHPSLNVSEYLAAWYKYFVGLGKTASMSTLYKAIQI